VYKDAAGSGIVTLERGACTLRFTHTYGLFNGQMDVLTFIPVEPPTEVAAGK
jgi:hypothetical protein